MAPAAPRSSAVIGSPARLQPATIRPSRMRRSAGEAARARIAITSLAVEMSNPAGRSCPASSSPSPIRIRRSIRSLVSSTRLISIRSGSKSRRNSLRRSSRERSGEFRAEIASLSARARCERLKVPSGASRFASFSSSSASASCSMRASIAAASRLLAAVTAWVSPVRCRLTSSIGRIWLYPPPAAPPFTPKVGPSEGWRMQANARLPRCAPIACASPIVTVVLPSPSGVGVIAVTSMYFPSGLSRSRSRISSRTLALNSPYSSSSSGRIPASRAIRRIGLGTAACAIARSLGTGSFTISRGCGGELRTLVRWAGRRFGLVGFREAFLGLEVIWTAPFILSIA